MNFFRRQQIDRLAEIVREACELQTPVNMAEAVGRLGGTLKKVDTSDFEAKIEKVHNGFRITLSKDANEKRERFSIAHEIGHLFLHMGYLVDEEKWETTGTYTDSVYYRYGHNVEEYEANQFAAEFLMPKAEFMKIARMNYRDEAYQVIPIAKLFDVSVEAAVNRGRWLGLFSWDKIHE